jgi:antitoxin component YwqK of YwqJK toxin-antitoxin module
MGKIRRNFIFILFLLVFTVPVFAQTNDSIHPNGKNVFYFENGKIASEGIMRNGKPDGYWKNYYKNGRLKSEGNRKNFLLDSLWKFYDEKGHLTVEITYKNGKKNGFRTTFQGENVFKENFINDIKQGYSYYLYPNGKVKMKIPFKDGLENGTAYEYAQDGRIIQIITYKKGYIYKRQRINRYDANHQADGRWIWFYPDGKVRLVGFFNHGLKNGYFKTYDEKGNLVSTKKYTNGEKEKKAEALSQLEVRTDYYPDGKIKVQATYNKKGLPEGIRREYDESGKVRKAYIFRNGKMIAEGIFTDAGQREGFWKEYYLDGSLKAAGFYTKDLKTGMWKYYYPDGVLEETGKYIDNDPDSIWMWYYPNHKILRSENFFEGQEDGTYTEYGLHGSVITKGEYVEGKKEGKWIFHVGDVKKVVQYADGRQNGWSRYYYADGTLFYEGKFIDGLPNGEHKWYWSNGKLKETGTYSMGLKNGNWKKFDKEGNIIISIIYQRGKEMKVDGVKID